MRREAADDLNRITAGGADKARTGFDAKEIMQMVASLRHVFDLVRLVDPARGCELVIREDGAFEEKPYSHYAMLDGDDKSGETVAMRVLYEKNQLTKFEFVNDDLYHITVKYVEVDGRPCTLEMVSRVSDSTLLEGIGKPEIVEAISRHNTRMYIDPVTKVYNRRYYEDRFLHMNALRAVVMVDVDDFKEINDTYGHSVGDAVLGMIAKAITSCVRASDVVIRYGGDEFLVVFNGIPREALPGRMRTISEKVQELYFEGHPELQASVSTGGAYGRNSIPKLVDEADRNMYLAKGDRDH